MVTKYHCSQKALNVNKGLKSLFTQPNREATVNVSYWPKEKSKHVEKRQNIATRRNYLLLTTLNKALGWQIWQPARKTFDGAALSSLTGQLLRPLVTTWKIKKKKKFRQGYTYWTRLDKFEKLQTCLKKMVKLVKKMFA